MVYRTFPFRLHHILEEASKHEDESCSISWLPCGKSFKIHDLDGFKEKILPKYLPKQSKYKSFKRQLQYYGFTNYGANQYGHNSFQRDQKSLLCQIEHRAFKKSKGIVATSDNIIDRNNLPPLQPSSSSSLSSSSSSSGEQQHQDHILIPSSSSGVVPQKIPSALAAHLRSVLLPGLSLPIAEQQQMNNHHPQVTPEMLLLAHEYRQMSERAQMLRALTLEQSLQSNMDSLAGLALLRELQGATMIQSLNQGSQF